MARRRKDLAWPPRSELRLLNTDLPRVDGPLKVSGRAQYTHDVRLPGMVYARLLLARIASGTAEVDPAPALALPGVLAVHVLEEAREGIRFLGQPLAAVAAETPELAEDGVRALAVEYEARGACLTRAQAQAEGAPAVSGRGNVQGERTRGDEAAARAALAECDAIIEAEYEVPVQHHACLETHGVVVDYRGGDEATVYASTQGTITIAGDCAEVLGLSAGKVHVLVDHMGGGFGGKFGPGVEGRAACELAKELERPVHLMLTRKDEFLMAGNRSGALQKVSAGATKDGKLRALLADITRLGGLGGGSHPGLPYIYSVEQSYSKTRSVLTNTDASRAMRAPGHPQASFAMESIVDELAYALALDPLEFRMMNLEDEVWHRQLDRVAREIGWPAHPHRTRPGGPRDWTKQGIATGIGFGVSTWNGAGRANDKVEVRIERDGSVTASVASQDLGTGTKTYVAAIVAEELGLPLAAVVPRIGDSRYGPGSPSGGSVTTPSLAPAVKSAAHAARLALLAKVAPVLGAAAERLVARDGAVSVDGDAAKKLSWREACATLGAEGLGASGEWASSLSSSGIHGAQAVKVTVDTLTGALQLVKMVCIQDMGLCLNRLAARSQLNGGMVQALSYGLFEERVLDADLGVMLNANFEEYKLAGCTEIPEMVALVDDEDQRGVIGMAEAPVIPGHAAIANAIFNACGVRLRSLPLSPDKILNALVAGGAR